jgi:hypothetical protein
MRFIFDELLPAGESLPPRFRHAQQQMERSLAAAGGIAELLGQSLQDPPQSARRVYLKELEQTLGKCTSLNHQMMERSSPRAQRVSSARKAAQAKGAVNS